MTNSTPMTTRREHAESIAAELMQRDVYVALQSEGVPEKIGGEQVGGCYSRRLDLSLRPWLEATGRWHGRRPAVYIDDVRDNDGWGLILLHELAHVADMGVCPFPAEIVSPVLMEREEKNWREHRDDPPKIDETLGYEAGHGPRFVRACVHLWHRAKAMGYGCNPENIYDGDLYGVPKGFAAVAALGDEITRLEQLWVATIVKLPAPKQFNELFNKESK